CFHSPPPTMLSTLSLHDALPIFAAHGSQKLFGAFEGPGLQRMVEMMGPMGYPVTIGEFFGGLGLVVGFLCRFSAASLIVIMIGRSEEHTSELQSQSNLVCRLLLE